MYMWQEVLKGRSQLMQQIQEIQNWQWLRGYLERDKRSDKGEEGCGW